MPTLQISVFRDADLIDRDKKVITNTLFNQGFGNKEECWTESQRLVKKIEYTQTINSGFPFKNPEELVSDLVGGRVAKFKVT